jgi:hypothetical protein
VTPQRARGFKKNSFDNRIRNVISLTHSKKTETTAKLRKKCMPSNAVLRN